MTVLSLTNPTPGTTADANMIASNNNAILAVVNGGLDHNNLSASAGIVGSQLLGYPADTTKFYRGDGTWAVPPAPSTTISTGTALPGSPTDGQEFILVDSTTNPTFQWRFRYNASNSTSFKWECVGGVPAEARVDTNQALSNASISTYQALATTGPSFTAPRAGIYRIEVGAYIAANTSANAAPTIGYMSYDVGGTGAVDADAAQVMTNSGTGGTAGDGAASGVSVRQKTLAASDAVVSKYRNNATGNNVAWMQRYLSILPIRVS